MKKNLYNLLLLLLLSPFFVFMSCNDPIGGGGDEPEPEPTPDVPGTPAQVYKDKKDFENIALELVDEFNASDFENILELAEYIGETYAEYEVDEAEEWLEECLGTLTKVKDTDKDYDVYETIYRLSAFKGKFVAEDGRWVKYKSDNLSLHVKDQNGKPCEITLTAAGDVKRVLCFTEQTWEGFYNNETGEYNEHIGEENIIWLDVPEKITLVLKQNGKELLKAVIETDLSSMKGDEFNLSEDKYNVSANLYFNGYTFVVDKIHYENNKESKAEFEFKHGDKVLLSSALVVTPEISGAIDEDFDYEDGDANLKNNVLTINVLDKLEIKGSCENVMDLVEVLDSEWDSSIDGKVNRYIDINLYFYGVKEPVAEIKFECFEDEYSYEWGSYTDYYLVPVIVFNDGSKNSIEDFFNEDDFEKVINAVENLFDEFEDLVEGYEFDF